MISNLYCITPGNLSFYDVENQCQCHKIVWSVKYPNALTAEKVVKSF